MPNVPYVPLPQVQSGPAGSSRQSIDGVSSAAFGGLEGAALKQVGDTLRDSFDWLARSAEKNKNYDKESDLLAYQQRSAQAWEDAKNNQTGDPRNFLTDFTKGREEDSNALRAKYPGDKDIDLRLKRLNFGYFTSALPQQAAKMNEYYKENLGERLTPEVMAAGKDASPADVNARADRFDQLVDKSAMTPAAKEEYKAKTRGLMMQAYALGKAGTDPETVLSTVDPGGRSYAQRLRAAEGPNGGPNRARTSSANGYYQWTTGTWTRVVNSPEGKAAGLRLDGRNNIEQENKALEIFTGWNRKILDREGIPITDKNLRMMHFLGEGDGVRFLKALQTNPNAPAVNYVTADAAAANGSVFYVKGDPSERRAKTLAEVYNAQTRGFGGKDSVIASLDPGVQMKLAGQAEKTIIDTQRQVQAEAAQQQIQYVNNAGIRAESGDYRRQDLEVDYRTGRIDERQYNALDKVVTAREAEDYKDLRATTKLQPDSGYRFNRQNKEDVEDIDRIAKDLTPEQQMALSASTGYAIVPTNLGNVLLGGLRSGQGPQMVSSARVAAELLVHNGSIFQGMSGGDELASQVAEYNKWKDLKYDDKQIAEKLQERYEKEAKGVTTIKDRELNKEKDRLSKLSPTAVLKDMGLDTTAIWQKSAGMFTPGLESAFMDDYQQAYMDEYMRSGDSQVANNFAKIKLGQVYGTFEGKLMKYPPQNAHYVPDSAGSWKYMTDDMMATAKRVAPGGQVVDTWLTPNPMTRLDIEGYKVGQKDERGRPVPLPQYDLNYSYKLPNGQLMYGTVTGYVGPYVEKANAELQAERERKAAGVVAPGEASRRRGESPEAAAARETRANAERRARQEEAGRQLEEQRKADEELERKFLEKNAPKEQPKMYRGRPMNAPSK